MPSQKSAKLAELSDEIFGRTGFDALKTPTGVVATKWIEETPLIFKSDPRQALGRVESFVPGLGATLGETVQTSCSAYPYFHRKQVTLPDGDKVEALDGDIVRTTTPFTHWRMLRVAPQAVSQWKRVPAERVLQVELVTGVSRHDLLPDLYPSEPSTSRAADEAVTR